MIKNKQQYNITKAQVQKFEQALAKLTQYSEEIMQDNPLLWGVKKSTVQTIATFLLVRAGGLSLCCRQFYSPKSKTT